MGSHHETDYATQMSPVGAHGEEQTAQDKS